jgi:DGQHR domain-containing protein
MTEIIELSVVRVIQPIGEIYIGSIKSEDLWRIAEVDMREIRRGEDGIYLATGMQRKLNEKRADEIATYVKTVDATFPTAVVLAISSDCVSFSGPARGGCLRMRLTSADEDEGLDEDADDEELFSYQRIARVIDGQHRIEGLRRAGKTDFDVNVAIFVDADIEDQARVFATVNLAQTKVSKSLVYDLFSFSTSRSPEKTAHSVCLSLDQTRGSPLYERIKRLGTATPGRLNEEPLSQATVVEGILSHIVRNKRQLIEDRDWGRRGRSWRVPSEAEARKLVLRRFFAEERDVDIAELLWNYFSAVKETWGRAWEVSGTGKILPRTNGYRALMRFFKDAYNHLAAPGEMVDAEDFGELLRRARIPQNRFTTETYPPGTTGESRLYGDLLRALK